MSYDSKDKQKQQGSMVSEMDLLGLHNSLLMLMLTLWSEWDGRLGGRDSFRPKKIG